MFLVPYLFHPKCSSLFMIFVMEIKALGQLHFKYCAEVEENVQQDKCPEVRDPLESKCALLVTKPSGYSMVVFLFIVVF